MMVTYKIGTGLVIARRADGTWSPPSAISTCGIGYGVQVSDLSSVLSPDMKLVYYYSQVLRVMKFSHIVPFRLEVS